MLKITQITSNPKKKCKKKMRAVKRKRRTVASKVRKHKRKAKIIRVKRNPPKRKRVETIIVGFAGGTREPRGKRYYYTGSGFSRLKTNAKIFPGDAAKMEARRILPILPSAIYGITVERV